MTDDTKDEKVTASSSPLRQLKLKDASTQQRRCTLGSVHFLWSDGHRSRTDGDYFGGGQSGGGKGHKFLALVRNFAKSIANIAKYHIQLTAWKLLAAKFVIRCKSFTLD
ncbi:hypothetical protein CDAR_443561 [Caerostris darwini]|uniref:Uncharacterized protein n=1 Tax=Caerostris darwini TaxID=1538125 RepID=A0AAV4TPE4_9ARAC|nr:hypothetical protein CDAR_443561 [Caerostris darwini]